MLSVITNVYNKKTEGPILMELFTATEKLKKFFTNRDVDVCTTGDTAHIDMTFKFLPHTRQYGCNDILHYCNDPCLKAVKNIYAPLLTHVWQELKYRIDMCRVTRGAHIEHL
jgi:hypothetical protein